MAKIDKKQLSVADRLAKLQLFLARLERDFKASPRWRNPTIIKCINSCTDRLNEASIHFFSGEMDKTQKILDLASIYIGFAWEILDSDEIEASLGEGDYLELELVKPEDDLMQLFENLRMHIENVRKTLV